MKLVKDIDIILLSVVITIGERKKMSSTKRTFITGAAILASASLISKLLGAVYRIPYQNIVGDVGLAAFNKVYPLYSILLIIATAGIPLAISKIVAERLSQGDKYGAKKVLRISIVILSITGLFFFLALFFGAETIAKLMGNIELVIVIKSISFALLIVPVMAAIRGYYQGHQNMIPTATSQVFEQLTRVITILVLSYYFIVNGFGVYYAAAGATFGAVTGGVVSFIVLLFYWKKTSTMTDQIVATSGNTYTKKEDENLDIIKKILYYSIPIALGSIFLPLLSLIDSFSVSNILKLVILKSEYLFGTYYKAQNLTNYTEYWFGIFSRGQALVQFAVFYATALSIALVPAISEAKAKKNNNSVIKGSDLAIRLTLMLGLPASVGIAVLAEPINIMLYKDGVGSITIAIYAFVIVFSTLYTTSAGILQGVGKVMVPAKSLFFGVIIKTILNIVLVYYFSINGAVIATIVAYAFASTLNITAMKKYIGIKINISNLIIKPTIAALMMGIIVYVSRLLLLAGLETYISSERLLMLTVILVCVILGIIAYGISLFLSGAITKEDLLQVPKFGNKIVKIAEKLKILKK